MELSKKTINELEILQNSSLVNEECFSQLLETVCNDIVRKNEDKNSRHKMHGSKPDVAKCAYAGVLSLFVEAARHKLDVENLGTSLHSAKIFGERAEKLCECYGKHRDSFVTQLSQIGGGLPCVVDVDWRLDYCVKSNTNDSIGECLYHVRFVTKKHGKLNHVQFACTIQQLQDLVYKLKEAVRHVEKIGNTL